jgi:hypothetical protein
MSIFCYKNKIVKAPENITMEDDIKENIILEKKKVINDILIDISKDKNKYMILWKKFKKRDNIIKSSVHVCNALSISSLVSAFASLNPVGVILGLIFGSCSSVGSTLNDSCSYNEKYYSCKMSAGQIADLEREIKAILIKNHLTSAQLDNLIETTNYRLSLIYDGYIL